MKGIKTDYTSVLINLRSLNENNNGPNEDQNDPEDIQNDDEDCPPSVQTGLSRTCKLNIEKVDVVVDNNTDCSLQKYRDTPAC